ncbi:MAG: orotidine-5'-phosphate decarboxylase [Candidatus Micrarchaeota archaeon]|nr:orotidine-5'-phosphate decarboxylase [Candidatus Micrarchaeota archaeon]
MQAEYRKVFLQNAMSRDSTLILAVDTADWKKAQRVLSESAKNIAAVKVHPEYADIWGFSHESAIGALKRAGDGVPVILDAKIADIEKSNAMKAEYYFTKGYDAIICHGFPGEKAVEAVVSSANKMRKGVFLLTAMTSPGHLFKKEVTEEIAQIAKKLDVAGVIAPGNQYDLLAMVRKLIGDDILILSPGIGAQGGDAGKAFKAGSNFAIVGRGILDSANPKEESRKLREIMRGSIPVC